MISLDEYESLNETAYLHHSLKNAIKLFESFQELADNGGEKKGLVE